MYKLVIVDDEEIIRVGLTKMVEMCDSEYKVVGEAANGREGLEAAVKLNPDVMIVDVKMPVMDGLEMIDCVKQVNPHTQFIILSAFTDYNYMRQAVKSGVADYLTKPVNRFELSALLGNIKNKLIENTRQALQPDGAETAAPAAVQKSDRKIIEMAKEYIQTNFFNDVSLESAARHVHMNTNYFSSLFKKETGQNFIDYLTQVRIGKAKGLLENPNLKIYEICQIVGYYSPRHFARIFKDIVGVTPTEYRDGISK